MNCFEKAERRRMSHGYIMIDMLVVASISAMLMSMVSIWIYQSMRYSIKVNDREQHYRSIARLSSQLRSDVRNGTAIELVDGALIVTLAGDGEAEPAKRKFTVDGNLVHVSDDGSDRGLSYRDDFEFAPNAKLRFDDSELPNWVTLEIGRSFSDMTVSKKLPVEARLDAEIRVGPRLRNASSKEDADRE
jgi:type II secretory pathway pseudopilin PulG